MNSPSKSEGDQDYETVLVRQDRWNLRVWLVGVVILGLVVSSWFDALWALFTIAPLMVLNTVVHAWQARRTIRMGYVVRGQAMASGVWLMLAVTTALTAVFWVQVRYGLWFTQYFREGYH